MKENRALPTLPWDSKKASWRNTSRKQQTKPAQNLTKKPASRPEGKEYNGVVAMHDLWDDDQEEAVVEHASGANSE